MTDSIHKRTIRSFVRREGRMTRGQKRAFDDLWPQFGLDIKNSISDLDTLFGRGSLKVLEIGFGMGNSLAAQAKDNAQHDYIGIEVHRPGVGHLLSQIEKLELNNIRIFNADAVEVLQHCIVNNSLDVVQIFFPDPWHKKRHHKRRLIQKPFVELVARKLKTGGKLHITTDWENYAEHIVGLMREMPQYKNTAKNGDFVPRPMSRPLTKFEQRGQRLGHGVWDLIFLKK